MSLCRVDHIVDGHGLTMMLLEVIDACSEELQKDIISFIPEISPDADTEVIFWPVIPCAYPEISSSAD